MAITEMWIVCHAHWAYVQRLRCGSQSWTEPLCYCLSRQSMRRKKNDLCSSMIVYFHRLFESGRWLPSNVWRSSTQRWMTMWWAFPFAMATSLMRSVFILLSIASLCRNHGHAAFKKWWKPRNIEDGKCWCLQTVIMPNFAHFHQPFRLTLLVVALKVFNWFYWTMKNHSPRSYRLAKMG